ncbi:polyprenyl synthetase family protein [Nakamurella sp.]|uniref:polyprenyl synthetase family protein n=1 Tax=Nakamurella sp. TaxID=1869182 RepID=UPI003B3AC894
MNRHTGRVTPAADRSRADRLHEVIAGELDRRRADVLSIDGRLAGSLDLLVDFVSDGGKRIRPEFLWCGWRAGGGPEAGHRADAALRVGAALEFLQACALLHDDVIDRSERRRGRPATHRAVAGQHAGAGLAGDPDHYGVSVAILLGDLALAWADDLFLDGAERLGALSAAAPVWRAMRTEVLAGQLLDLAVTASVVDDPAAQERDALLVNRYKTAAYTVERPLHLGAALAGAGAATIAALRGYGADIGVAFQLRDDLLGVFGDPAVTGKPAGDDLAEGKRTMLLARARAGLAADPDGAAALAALDDGVGRSDADAPRLAAVIAGTGAVEAVEDRIATLVESALAALDAAPDLPDPVHERLTELADKATARSR